MLKKILSQYSISPDALVEVYGSGLINRTWLVKDRDASYILQRINQNVFNEPWRVAENIELVGCYLQKNHPGYFFVVPVKTADNKSMTGDDQQGWYRLFPFIKGSKTYDVVQSTEQAFEAAKQFGCFTSLLSGFPVNRLKITLPGFHDLTARYQQFEQACVQGNAGRIKEAVIEISLLRQKAAIVSMYEAIKSSVCFKTRVTHHDTKISNVLFDKYGKGLCVIDLDTVMPGYFISDVGDMLRTYLSPVSEEEKDFSKIEVREDYFKAIVDGYLFKMHRELQEEELKHFVYAGKFMVYMQALRFLTDYLNNDSYYGAVYEGHNYYRAKNQLILLERLEEKQERLNELVTKSFIS